MKKMTQYRTQVRWNLIRRKPLFLLRVAKHYLENILFPGRTRLRTMTVMINAECNCKCEHCFAESFNQSKQRFSKLTKREMIAALKEMVDNGVYHFCLQGGETFLHPDLDDLIRACEPRKSYINLVTNGTIADERRLKEVYDLGVDKIAVSIDSYYPGEHDKFRNLSGCHDRAMRTVDMALKVGLDVGLAVTVMNETLHSDSVQKLIEYVGEKGINLDINIPQPVGNWDGRTDVLLTDENFEYINNLHRENVHIRRDLYPHIGRAGCPAVKESMHMCIYGYIYPCVYIHCAIGNIREHNLRDIRKNALTVSEFSKYEPKCLGGEDRPFIERYISRGFGKPKPADGIEIFGLGEVRPRRDSLV